MFFAVQGRLIEKKPQKKQTAKSTGIFTNQGETARRPSVIEKGFFSLIGQYSSGLMMLANNLVLVYSDKYPEIKKKSNLTES